MPKPPLIYQTDDFSCVPTCILMVLNSLNCNPPMYELRELCKCTEEGTSPSNAISAIKHYGFENSSIAYLENVEELKEELSNGLFPIVYLKEKITNHAVVKEEATNHAVVVVEIKRNKVFVLDPYRGERTLELEQFQDYWHNLRGLTIIIE